MKKDIIIGLLVSLFATFCGMFIYTEYIVKKEFIETLVLIQQKGALGMLIALSAIPNLFVFFIYIKKCEDYKARGVLIGTILIALLTFVLKFI